MTKEHHKIIFLEACKVEREAFCFFILKEKSDTKTRVNAENILIMYDQLVAKEEDANRYREALERITRQPQHTMDCVNMAWEALREVK